MAEIAYLKLFDKRDGKPIEGGCQEQDRGGLMEVQAFRHLVTVPTHSQTGAATGETLHGPLVITKPLDRASPLLQLALSEHHELEGSLSFYRTRDGKRRHWYSIHFADARLVSIRTCKDLVLRGGDAPDLETLRLRYRSIKWEHREQSKEAEADWLSR